MVPSARTAAAAAALLPAAFGLAGPAAAQPQAGAVVETYADIAHAMYEDSLTSARALDASIQALIANPTADSLDAARTAWLAARIPYQQTEVFRFGNPVVDDWEGRVNAWPLDEGLIDYVDTGRYGEASDMNLLYTANVVAHTTLTFGGRTIDTSSITPALLSEELHEADNIEANVATGYHAIEFLLWGQDLNGTGPGAGNRPYTDFDTADCTGGNCDRRVAYLMAASELLLADLEEMVANWADGGAARDAVTGDPEAGLSAIVTGLGSLSYGELAGERMQLGLMLHDPEEEHDCFADNTHNSHYYNQVGMIAVYSGDYHRIDGSTVAGPALADLVAAADPALAESVDRHMGVTLGAMQAMVAAAENGMAYDQMLGEGNAVGNALLQTAIDALVAQAGTFESVVAALDLEIGAFEGSDSLDNPDAVFQ